MTLSVASDESFSEAAGNREEWMKYLCLGYIEQGKFEGMTEDERNRVFDECFEHNDHLRASGHLVAGELRFSLRRPR